MKVKKIYKYGTGDAIPDGSQYLATITETKSFTPLNSESNMTITIPEMVWHYFLVEVEDRV